MCKKSVEGFLFTQRFFWLYRSFGHKIGTEFPIDVKKCTKEEKYAQKIEKGIDKWDELCYN